MFLILKLLLIILFNETYAYIMQDSEIILLPAWNLTGAKEISLTLKVFEKIIQLNLRRNDQFLSPEFEVWKYNKNNVTEKMSHLKSSNSCFYLHEDHVSSAVINLCQENGMEGLVFVENDTLEIRPLRNEFEPLSLTDDFCIREQVDLSFGKPYLIKKLLSRIQYFPDLNLYHSNNFISKRRYIRSTQQKLTIELAVFFDETAYRTFMPLLDNDKKKIRYMILACVNSIQTAFHHPSLGVSIDISLVRLDIMEKQPLNFSNVDVEYTELLTSFCKYANSLNPPDDDDPRHWDIALYLTGIDLYKIITHSSIFGNSYQKDYYASGVSNLNGACNQTISCAIVEFEKSALNISLPILRTSLIATHEIGHLLGLNHDSLLLLQKDKELYIMADYENKEQRQPEWSPYSRLEIEVLKLWDRKECLRDHTRSENLNEYDLPGREWTAKAQCEIFLLDKDANVVTLHDICISLQCETPHKNWDYFLGPALDGTYCKSGKECRSGKCVPVTEPPYILEYSKEEDDNWKWNEWKKDSCNSSCLEKSKGVMVKRRTCKYQTHRSANCIGPYYDIVLCEDSSLCTENRKGIAEFTIMKCTEFNRIISELEIKSGLQAPHKVDKPWIACTIFCARKNSSTYSAPRLKMLQYGINPYFPDGTWCHKKDDQDYYCRQHYCLPQNYSFE